MTISTLVLNKAYLKMKIKRIEMYLNFLEHYSWTQITDVGKGSFDNYVEKKGWAVGQSNVYAMHIDIL